MRQAEARRSDVADASVGDNRTPAMEGKISASVIRWVLGGAALILVLYYARLHVAVIQEPWPITVRESAFILQTQALLDPAAPPMYSIESLPAQANLYGPVYPAAAVPAVLLWPDHPYLAHRLTTGLFLLLSCLLLGWSVATRAGGLNGGLVAALFYVANVATPSPAAGPDTLATLFYIGSFLVIQHRGTGVRAIAASVVFAVLALMTKPYAALTLPALLLYLFLHVSMKRAVIAGGVVGAVSAVGAGVISRIWPVYFFSTFEIHASFATRVFDQLKNQLVAFSAFNFAVIALFVAGCWLRRGGRSSSGSLQGKGWDRPLLKRGGDWMRFMTITAVAAIVISLGWHGGAYLIYLNHLILPPLLVGALGSIDFREMRRATVGWAAVVMVNVVVLVLVRPSLPEPRTPMLFRNTDRVLVDPVFEPLSRRYDRIDLVDHGQAEYIVEHAWRGADGPERDQVVAWTSDLASRIAAGYYDYILLVGYHRRPHLMTGFKKEELLDEHYALFGLSRIHPYYFEFTNPRRFGQDGAMVFVYRRRAPAPSVL